MKTWIASALLSALVLSLPQPLRAAATASPPRPVKIIFDTDIGNDVDDVLALSMLHALQTRGQCELLGVTITIPDEQAAPFVDAVNTFYGRPDLPIGCVRPSASARPTKFLKLAETRDGERLRYPHDLARGSDAPPAAALLRKLLSREADSSVVLVQVGYFSNLAALLETGPDAASPLAGPELVKQKVRWLSVMAGSFKPIGQNQRFREFNVVQDLPASKKVARDWPTPIVWSGFEIGIAVPYPAISIERDFSYVAHHPAAEAYWLYEPPPHNRPTWDLTSVLYAVFPDRGYFDLSPPGRVTVEEDGFTSFAPAENGRDRYLVMSAQQEPRVLEALVQLASQPPASPAK
jgi:hypothetical protein